MARETKSTWHCPGCHYVFRKCHGMYKHLEKNPECMKTTLNPKRKSAVCKCDEEGRCRCGFKERLEAKS